MTKTLIDFKEKAVQYQRGLEINYDFMWKALVQTVDLLVKGTTFYFTVFGIISGLVFTQKLANTALLTLISASFLISVIFGMVVVAFAYGVVTGLVQLRRALRAIDHSAFDMLAMDDFFKRGIAVCAFSVLCCLAILVVVTVTLLSRI